MSSKSVFGTTLPDDNQLIDMNAINSRIFGLDKMNLSNIGSNNIGSNLTQQQMDTMIKNNQFNQNVGNTLQGIGTLGNMYLGYKNYGMAKDQLSMQKEQHELWKEDRLEAKARRDKIAKIRF